MRTFTFVEYYNRETGFTRTLAVRGEIVASSRHLNRFLAGRNWEITSIYQCDGPDLPTTAQHVAQYFSDIQRRSESTSFYPIPC